MGTRADFYVRTDGGLEWLGSVAWDGYDIEEMTEEDASKSPRNQSCWVVAKATTEAEFRAGVTDYFSHRKDATTPDMGWPWPWEDSTTTDYAYVFDGARTRVYAWGKEALPDDGPDDGEGDEPDGGWPNMAGRQNVAYGKRSGVIIVGK